MTHIKACIFDLDGVIVDTARYHFLAWKRLAEELDIPFTEEDNEQLKGVSRVESLKLILQLGDKELSQETFEAALQKKNTWFVEFIHQMTPAHILPGVRRFLDELQTHHIRIALGSASKNAETILSQIQMTDYFEVIMDGNKITKAKPDPEVFLKGAEALGVRAEDCVVFEDAVKGIEAAQKGGMYAIGVGDEKILHKADFVIQNFEKMHLERLSFKEKMH